MAGVVQISCLGSFGRFGNQLFQYAFARGYAEEIGAELQTPPWIGQLLFGVADPPIIEQLPRLELDEHPDDRADVDLYGYFQYRRAFEIYKLGRLRAWFTFRPEILARWAGPPAPAALHLRRGDYVGSDPLYCTVELAAYHRAMQAAGLDLDWIQVVSEEEPTLTPLAGAEWLQDFITLMRAEVLFRANSTFSWWAATLGGHRVFSPVVEGLRGPHSDVPFVEGNHPRCIDLPGVDDYVIAP